MIQVERLLVTVRSIINVNNLVFLHHPACRPTFSLLRAYRIFRILTVYCQSRWTGK